MLTIVSLRCILTLVTVSDAPDLDSRLANMRSVIHELPRMHFDLLKRLVEHLDKYVVIPLGT